MLGKWRLNMFEIPEYITLASQMAKSIAGKRIIDGDLGSSPHKFVWHNMKTEVFAAKIKGRTVGTAYSKGRWLFVPIEKGYILVFGECGGRIQLHESASMIPKKHHLSLRFDDGSALSATTQMWGAMELHEKGKELERKYIRGMRTTPIESGFSDVYLAGLVKEAIDSGNKTVKSLLTQDQLIPGLGNAIAQDIMFEAKLHPKQSLEALGPTHIKNLRKAIVSTIKEAIRLGGRYDEYDLHGSRGKYSRQMDKNAVGRPCPRCGKKIEKMTYLGGACYFCSACLPLIG